MRFIAYLFAAFVAVATVFNTFVYFDLRYNRPSPEVAVDFLPTRAERFDETRGVVYTSMQLSLFRDTAEDQDGSKVAALTDDWVYVDFDNDRIFRVMKYFRTDFASIPAWARIIAKVSAIMLRQLFCTTGCTPLYLRRIHITRATTTLERIEISRTGTSFRS